MLFLPPVRYFALPRELKKILLSLTVTILARATSGHCATERSIEIMSRSRRGISYGRRLDELHGERCRSLKRRLPTRFKGVRREKDWIRRIRGCSITKDKRRVLPQKKRASDTREITRKIPQTSTCLLSKPKPHRIRVTSRCRRTSQRSCKFLSALPFLSSLGVYPGLPRQSTTQNSRDFEERQEELFE